MPFVTRSPVTVAAVLTATLFPLAARAQADTAEPSATAGPRGRDKQLAAVRATAAPVIDGRLDDVVWQSAPAGKDFTQIQPGDGKAPSEKTEFRIMYDDDHVYVGIHCYDDEPDKMVTRLTRRDRDI